MCKYHNKWGGGEEFSGRRPHFYAFRARHLDCSKGLKDVFHVFDSVGFKEDHDNERPES